MVLPELSTKHPLKLHCQRFRMLEFPSPMNPNPGGTASGVAGGGPAGIVQATAAAAGVWVYGGTTPPEEPITAGEGSAREKKGYEELAEASHHHRHISRMVKLKCLPVTPACPRGIPALVEFGETEGLVVGAEVAFLPAAVKRICL